MTSLRQGADAELVKAGVDAAGELIVVGVSNGAVCASALADETMADAVRRAWADPNHSSRLL